MGMEAEGASGARLLGDITRDGGGSEPAEVTAVGDRLFLAATTAAIAAICVALCTG